MDYYFDMSTVYVNNQELVFKEIIFTEVLGKGANAIVLKGKDTVLNREVALKIWMPRHGYAVPDEKRFLEEVRKIVGLRHPSIVQIYKADSISNYYYAEMELVEGITLEEWLKTSPSDRKRLIVAQEIINALDYSHSNQVYHGDMHEKNIMIINDNRIKNERNNVKIIDFGTSIFSPNSSNLRASYLLARTLTKLINLENKYNKYINFLHEDILYFLNENNFKKVKETFKGKNFLPPECVLGSFEVLIETILVLEEYMELDDKTPILIDLGFFYAKSPFLKLNNVIKIFQEYLNENEIKNFYYYIKSATNFDEQEIRLLMTNEIENILINLGEAIKRSNVGFEQWFIEHPIKYQVWRNFCTRVQELRNIRTFLHS
jgi:tRNA A-37 threonylcarbamoyl transferase component Bud32